MTDAELALWKVLRGRQFSGHKFRHQHPFGDYILDFVCLSNKLVIEVDGGQYCSQAKNDEVRTKRLQSAGFHVLRFWNNEVIEEFEAVKERIWMTIQELRPHPLPGPPLEREGENQEHFLLSSSAPLRCAAWCVAMISAFCVLSSCATAGPAATITRPSITWPMASAKSKIVWVKTIERPGDFANNSGFWHRMLEVITDGEETNVIVRPYGVLRSAAMLYLADPGAGLVHCLNITNGSYSVIGGNEDSPLRSPIGLTEDDSGRLYITDSVAGMVYRYNPKDGSMKPFLANTGMRPTGIAFHPLNKMLYVVDTLGSQIVVVDQHGVERRRLAGRNEGIPIFNRPTDLAIDARGLIYLCNSLNFRITVLTPEGQVVRQFGEPGDAQGFFSRPKGIAVDSVGNIYVNDALMDAVQVFDQNGALQLVFGRKGVGPGQFWLPSGLFIDRSDQIYVVDTYNRRIQVFRYLANRGDEEDGDDADMFDKLLP